MFKSAIFATNLKEFVIITGLLLIAWVVVKVIIAIRSAKRMPEPQDLIDKGIHPTIQRATLRDVKGVEASNNNE